MSDNTMDIVCDWAVEDIPGKDISVLRVSGVLDIDSRSEFKKGAAELMKSVNLNIVIDLSKVAQIAASLYIGTLTDIALSASDNGKVLSILMKEQLARVSEHSGLGRIARIIVASR
ncbi:MAG: hypothetical protein JXR97_00040 [Planctomycetes bacterium]|nr:hypothetical protein [Planctomycetota bacterium]